MAGGSRGGRGQGGEGQGGGQADGVKGRQGRAQGMHVGGEGTEAWIHLNQDTWHVHARHGTPPPVRYQHATGKTRCSCCPPSCCCYCHQHCSYCPHYTTLYGATNAATATSTTPLLHLPPVPLPLLPPLPLFPPPAAAPLPLLAPPPPPCCYSPCRTCPGC